jgi:flagellin
MNILTGRFAQNSATGDIMQLQVGANMDQSERINIGTMTATALGLANEQGGGGIVTISSVEEANRTIGVVDDALKRVNKQIGGMS